MNLNRGRHGGNRKRKLTRTAIPVCGSLAAVLCGLIVPTAASAKTKTTTIYGSGSSAAWAYESALASEYHKLHKHIVIKYNPDGGNAGVKDVQAGRSEFAFQTALPVAANAGTLFYKAFRDALCIDVNKANTLTSLTEPQLAGIFGASPTYTAWSQVPGDSSSSLGSIDLEGRLSSAGQYTYFQSAVLNGGAFSSSVQALGSDGLVKTAISENPSAIGYVGLANSKGPKEKALEISSGSGSPVSCTAANVRKESYPLWRYDFLVLPGGSAATHKANAQAAAFASWVIHSKEAAKIVNKAGAVSL